MKDFLPHRIFVMPARAAVLAAAFSLAAAFPAFAAGDTPAASQAMTPAPVKGEFDDQCAMGLASGQNVKTDCSVNWTDTDGHIYCFSSDASKEAFLKDPAGNIQKAREFLASKQAAKSVGAKEFTEEDVDKRVQEVIADRSKDGAFMFHDPKLDTDLNLVYEQIKGVRGMEGYGWFANVIFHDKDEPKKQYAIDFWFKPDGDKLNLMDIRVQKGPKQDGAAASASHSICCRISRSPARYRTASDTTTVAMNPMPTTPSPVKVPMGTARKTGARFLTPSGFG